MKKKKLKQEKYCLHHKFFFVSGLSLISLIPIYILGYPSSPGPFPPTTGYFTILSFLVLYPLVVFYYLHKKIPNRLISLLRKNFGFFTIYLSLSIILILLEIGIRIIGFVDWGDGMGPQQRDWRLRKYKLNSQGFREPEIPLQPAKGVIRIMGIGDSFGFGQGVDFKDTYLEQLKRSLLLKIPGLQIEMLNKAKPGWSTIEEYNYFIKDGITYKPDIVVVLFVLNDPEIKNYVLWPLSGNYTIDVQLWRSQLYFSLVRVYNMIRHPYDKFVFSLFEEGSETSQYCRKALREFGKVCSRNDIYPVMAICPMIVDFDNYKFIDLHKKAGQWGHASGFDVIDILPYFRKSQIPYRKLRVTSQDWHPNALAHSIISNAISEKIADYLKNRPSTLKTNSKNNE